MAQILRQAQRQHGIVGAGSAAALGALQQERRRLIRLQQIHGQGLDGRAPALQTAGEQQLAATELGQHLLRRPGPILCIDAIKDQQPARVLPQPAQHRLALQRLLPLGLLGQIEGIGAAQSRQVGGDRGGAAGADQQHSAVTGELGPGVFDCHPALAPAALTHQRHRRRHRPGLLRHRPQSGLQPCHQWPAALEQLPDAGGAQVVEAAVRGWGGWRRGLLDDDVIGHDLGAGNLVACDLVALDLVTEHQISADLHALEHLVVAAVHHHRWRGGHRLLLIRSIPFRRSWRGTPPGAGWQPFTNRVDVLSLAQEPAQPRQRNQRHRAQRPQALEPDHQPTPGIKAGCPRRRSCGPRNLSKQWLMNASHHPGQRSPSGGIQGQPAQAASLPSGSTPHPQDGSIRRGSP